MVGMACIQFPVNRMRLIIPHCAVSGDCQCVAVRFKCAGTPYNDPYKDIPIDVEIRDLTKMFGKNMLRNADEFLPVDMSKYQALRTIAKLRQQLTQQLKEYYIK